MHAVHQLTMSADVFGVRIRAIPICVLGLFACFSMARDKLTVSQHIGTWPLYPALLLRPLCCLPELGVSGAECDVSVHVHVDLAVDLALELLLQLLELPLLLLIQPLQLLVLLSLDILLLARTLLLGLDEVCCHSV
jgi:hypothetical protein